MIYNYAGGSERSSATIDKIINSVFKNNSAAEAGGAIFNEAFTLATVTINTIDNLTFEGNIATRFGGAIFNSGGTINEISNTVFENNSVTYSGGAIYNDGYIEHLTNVSFAHNSVKSDDSAEGGAIYNNGYLGYLDNVSFIGNSANSTLQDPNMPSAVGGAIAYFPDMGLPLNILSSTGDTIFVGNSANGKSNAIYVEPYIYERYVDGVLDYQYGYNGTINLNAGDYNISILDGISGNAYIERYYYDKDNNYLDNQDGYVDDSYKYNTININNPDHEIEIYDPDGNIIETKETPSHGTVILANEIDGNTVNFYDGKLVLTHHTYTHLIAFWDGKSSGTKHMIEIAQMKGIPVWVFEY